MPWPPTGTDSTPPQPRLLTTGVTNIFRVPPEKRMSLSTRVAVTSDSGTTSARPGALPRPHS
jgi:hypothetical protein